MDRRNFLKGAGAVAGALAAGIARAGDTEPKAEVMTHRPETEGDGSWRESPHARPKNIRHAVWPLITDFAGMKLLDPVAAKKFADGWKEYKEPADMKNADDPVELEFHFQRYLLEEKPKFAKTKTGGWLIDCEELGYNPRDKYWTYFEYNEVDQYEVFGREPLHMGYDPEDPEMCFHFSQEECDKHRNRCIASDLKSKYPNTEVHT